MNTILIILILGGSLHLIAVSVDHNRVENEESIIGKVTTILIAIRREGGNGYFVRRGLVDEGSYNIGI